MIDNIPAWFAFPMSAILIITYCLMVTRASRRDRRIRNRYIRQANAIFRNQRGIR